MPSGITIEIIPEANGRYYFNKCRIETGVCKPATQYHQLPHNPDQYGKALISHEYGHAILEANTNFENIPEVKISEEAVILFDKRKEYDEMEASLFESAPNEIAIGKIELDAQSKYGRIHASAMIIAPLEVVKGYHELFADMVAATHLQSQGENPAKAIAFEGFENLGKKPKSNRPYQSDEHYTFTLAKHLLWKNHFSKAKKPAQFSALLKILAKAIAKTTSTQVRDSKMMYEFLNGTTNASTTHDKMSSELVENFNILLKQDI
jgi:hypothetical protein